MRTREIAHQLYAHFSWCVEKRTELITPEIENSIKSITQEICSEEKIEMLACEAVQDHVHLLIRFHPTHRLSDFIKLVKGRSSRMINIKLCEGFQWEKGYGVDTVGLKALEVARKYVLDQKLHHQIESR
jgi:putative transposase